MSVSLLNASKRSSKLLGSTLARLEQVFMKPGGISQVQQVCRMSSKRTMKIVPSRYEWTLFKDHLHFHVALHAIPIALIITYINMTRGRCEIADIPEDYEPKHWEYYKHPITRFISRVCYQSFEAVYEQDLHINYMEHQKRQLRMLEKKVQLLQAKRNDHQGWYYIPVNPNPVYSTHEETKHPEKYIDLKI